MPVLYNNFYTAIIKEVHRDMAGKEAVMTKTRVLGSAGYDRNLQRFMKGSRWHGAILEPKYQ